MSTPVALVTGGSRGIGFAIAHRLLTDGASVCVTARDERGLEEAARALGHPDQVMFSAGKSDDPAHRQKTVDAIIQRFGSLDILVNNAGVNPVLGNLVDLEDSAAAKIIDVNLLACLGWVKAMRSLQGDSIRGCVINIGSYATVRPSPGLGMYGVSKSALLQLTKQLALELAPHIRVNAVIPALIGTEFAAALYVDRMDVVSESYPLGRIGIPDDVASAVAFLASDDASWITGESLLIDGGLSLTGGVG